MSTRHLVLALVFAATTACGSDGGKLPDAAGRIDAPVPDAATSAADAATSTDDAAPDAAPSLSTTATFPGGLGALCGVGYAASTDTVWVYPCSGAMLHPFSGAGVAGTPIARPGEVANDVDVEVAGAAFTLGTTTLAAGDVVFVNGETDSAELYAAQGGSAVVLATAFGASHVVGAALHPMRGTVFAVQDRVPGDTVGNVIAELDATTGAVLASFSVLPAFSVNYGDLEVCRSNGYLFVVSSDEPTLAVFTPTGTLVDEYALPTEVASGASGIGLDDAAGAAWIASTNGNLVRIAGLPCQ
ncbi:MAG: hypothetical protein KBG28_07100 [Kofleriaceae bacterium]|nr:hypothetical protein [Kofleriaceae bacterium]